MGDVVEAIATDNRNHGQEVDAMSAGLSGVSSVAANNLTLAGDNANVSKQLATQTDGLQRLLATFKLSAA